jgi:hypothetical protein
VHKEGGFCGGLGQQLLAAFLHFGALLAGHFPCRQGRLPTGVKVAARYCFAACGAEFASFGGGAVCHDLALVLGLRVREKKTDGNLIRWCTCKKSVAVVVFIHFVRKSFHAQSITACSSLTVSLTQTKSLNT